MRFRRRIREQYRHDRAAVLQQQADTVAAARPVDDWKRQREIECARMERARRGGSEG